MFNILENGNTADNMIARQLVFILARNAYCRSICKKATPAANLSLERVHATHFLATKWATKNVEKGIISGVICRPK